jgi:hypothetical protein
MAKVFVIMFDEPSKPNGRDVVCYLRPENAGNEVRQLTLWGLNPISRKKTWVPVEHGEPIDAPKEWHPSV